MNFGEKIKQARLQQNLTMKDLSEILDTSPTYITHVEVHNEISSKEMIMKLCKTLNLDERELIELAIKSKMEKYEQQLRKKYD